MPYHCNRSKNQQQMKVLFTFLQLKLCIFMFSVVICMTENALKKH